MDQSIKRSDGKIKRFFQFISLLNVEIYLFCIMMTYALKKIPTDQLIQDKICLQKYHLNSSYCEELPTMNSDQDYLHKKSKILEDMTSFSLYFTMVITIPSIFASLLIGSWTDKYQGAKKTLMIFGGIAGVLENLILILNAYLYDIGQSYVILSVVPSCLQGGLLAIFTAVYAYIASTTTPKLMALRMMIAEVINVTAIPIGTYIGGLILNTSPTFKSGQLHNYTMVYVVGAGTNLFGLIWVLLRANEKRDIRLFRERFDNTELKEMRKNGQQICDKQKQFNDNKHIHPLKLLFDLSNIKDIWKTCSKPRTNKVRLQIWLLFVAMLCYLMAHIGVIVFMYPFAQKVYHWNSETYSNANAIGYVINALCTLTITPILIRVFHVKDMTLALIGLLAYFSQNIIRGLVLNATGFYISLVTGAIGTVTAVGMRTHFSKIVQPNELGKVFSLMSGIDSVAPLFAAAIFSSVFNATMDIMPGISFIILSGTLLIPLFITMWIDLYTVVPDLKPKHMNDNINTVNS